MKKAFLMGTLFFSMLVFGQNEPLAQDYFEKGAFEKALILYESLYNTNYSAAIYTKIISCYQQLEQFDKAEKTIRKRLEMIKQPGLWVDLGYNFQLQKDQTKADNCYNTALDAIKERPNTVYGIAAVFESKVLLEYALKAYELAIITNPNLNFDYQRGLIYGQLGNIDNMIDMFLNYAFRFPENNYLVQNQFSRFMTEDVDDLFNNALRKALLLRAQKDQDLFWNKYLSWYYIQQKAYAKAFVQEKAIYKRSPESFSNIVQLAQLAIAENENDTAREILMYILENTESTDLKIQAYYFLAVMKTKAAKESDYAAIMLELEQLIGQFGINTYTLPLQLLQAHFVTFTLNRPEEGKTILQKALSLRLNKYQAAEVKMELGDILLYEEKFNQALLYYSQIENDLKNDVVGHEASLKVARTSYYKGDFDWAVKQLKVLKASFSQLIANDAMALYLLIQDNTAADTTQTALRQFAKADFLLYQNKTALALAEFELILQKYKGEVIEDETLLKIAQVQEKQGDYAAALSYYQKIIDEHSEGIYIDEALYFSAAIYDNHLNDSEKAKALYEQILFHHQDSIYFTDARVKYRQLRGDSNS